MALNYSALYTLSQSATFRGRVVVSLWTIAKYHRGRPESTQAQRNWSAAVIDNRRVDEIATKILGELVLDNAFATASQSDASDVTDDGVKAAVETICFGYGA